MASLSALREGYGKIPLSFEANVGQTDARVQFLARGSGYALFLTPGEAVFSLHNSADPATGAVLRMQVVSGNAAPPAAGLGELPGRVNYFIGKDPSRWRTDVPTYARVEYRGVYDGIDLVYYGNQRQLEYDFLVAPGADPGVITLGFAGADRLEIDAGGDLVVPAGGGQIRQHRPVIYQEVEGVRREVEGGYYLKDGQHVGFWLGAHDVSRPLVIDPVLAYSAYLGGSSDEQGSGIAVDGSGNAYVTGYTESADFPTTAGAFDTTHNGGEDVFVTKISTAVNAARVNTVPGPQSTSPNQAMTFSAVNGNAISVADVDAGSTAVQVTLTSTNGTLTLSGTSGLSFTTGDGTADATMTFTGTITAINAAINGLRYDPANGFTGVASVTITTNDLGNSGAGGPQTDTDTVAITVSTSATVDLRLTVSAAPDPVLVGNPLTYSISVTNNNAGAFTATGVTLFNNLANGMTFVSATASQGMGCTQAGGTVTCNLGALANGATATVTIVATPTRAGMVVNRASVAANERDNDPANNLVMTQTRVNQALRLSPPADLGLPGSRPPAGAADGGANGEALTPQRLQAILVAALARWRATGVDAAGLGALGQVDVHVADLPGLYLGLASPGVIWIDQNAAGYGWFIDPTPADDEEFSGPGPSPAAGRVDLLTVVAHELGHVLGFEHSHADDLMAETLPVGIRRVPMSHAHTDEVLAEVHGLVKEGPPNPSVSDARPSPVPEEGETLLALAGAEVRAPALAETLVWDDPREELERWPLLPPRPWPVGMEVAARLAGWTAPRMAAVDLVFADVSGLLRQDDALLDEAPLLPINPAGY